MGVEFELKFSATKDVLSVICQAVDGKEAHYTMRTTYYDTLGKDLSARNWTLRCRRENEISVCTLKYPLEGEARGEQEVLCDKIEDAIPMLCKQSGLAELETLTAGGVVALCGAAFHRIAKTIRFQDSILELALDEGSLLGGGREIPLCEVEVELKEGNTQDARTYAAILAATYGLKPQPHSKFRRALDLAKGE